ncbi:zinc finger protein chinmo isoform X2 [Trichogramma pretiosum]|uniref:zinc finger protein chinmo isoform X2 n=1 Tax=Trichogramma pretiosum TaxID=7493 RepID=UPI000C71AA31|nr:zinc finger protein chinmo isoform X2 [Trichogramma pretiosum]
MDNQAEMDVDQGGRDDNQQFCLKWNSFGSNLAEAFSVLYRSGSMTDCTIFCAEQTFAVHRIVLAACSSFFMSVLEKTFPNSPHATVIILNVKPDNMKALLEFMYSGQVNVSQDTLKELLKDAENLQIKGLSVIDPEKVERMGPDEVASTLKDSRLQLSTRGPLGLHNNNNSHEDDHNNGLSHHQRLNHLSQQTIILNGHHGSSSSSTTPSNTPHNSSSSPGADVQQQQQQLAANNNAGQRNDLENGDGGSRAQALAKMRLGSESPNGHNNHSSAGGSPALTGIPGYGSFLAQQTMFYDSPQKRLMRKNGIKSELQDMSNRSAMINDANYRSSVSPHPSSHSMSIDPRFQYVANHLSPLAAASPQHHQRHSPNNLNSPDRHHDRDRSMERDDNNAAEDLSIKHEPEIKTEMELRNRLSTELYNMNGRAGSSSAGLYDGPAFPHNGESSAHQQAVVRNLIMSGGGNIALDASAGRPCSPSAWNAKINKAGTVSTPEGKKLKCPFCERLYGYETNLRAHVRQRHQGIRVPCPHCDRTFTRRNTVRRHIAREHKNTVNQPIPSPDKDPNSRQGGSRGGGSRAQ